jgi:heme/copper-type cytochrome/quinol oxidase subunit 2
VASFFAGGSRDGSARGRWIDWVVGILVGIVLGLGVLVYFVFVQSEGTIDAPKVNEGKEQATVPAPDPEQPAEEPKENPQTQPKPKPIPVVKVIGGAPPETSGPRQLHFTKGEKVRFEIETSEPFTFEIKGLGITQSIESTSTISFKATKAGQFPVIATATLIAVADLLIAKK